jgi:mannose-6-phosphate isomerase class I
MFKSDNWISFGFKPKKKDIKTIIDDLNDIEYLQTLENEDVETTVVLDGRKVRLGFESDKFEVLDYKYNDGYQKHNENIELIESL